MFLVRTVENHLKNHIILNEMQILKKSLFMYKKNFSRLFQFPNFPTTFIIKIVSNWNIIVSFQFPQDTLENFHTLLLISKIRKKFNSEFS